MKVGAEKNSFGERPFRKTRWLVVIEDDSHLKDSIGQNAPFAGVRVYSGLK